MSKCDADRVGLVRQTKCPKGTILDVRPVLRGDRQLGDADAARLLGLRYERVRLGSGDALDGAQRGVLDDVARLADRDVPTALGRAHDLRAATT